MNWWILPNGYCMRCSNTGLVPVFWMQSWANRFIGQETCLVCSSHKAHDFKYEKEKEDYDNGKRIRFKKTEIISRRFDEKFPEGTQFPWTEEMMRSRDPMVTYHEYYQVCMYESLRATRESGKMQLIAVENYPPNRLPKYEIKKQNESEIGKILQVNEPYYLKEQL